MIAGPAAVIRSVVGTLGGPALGGKPIKPLPPTCDHRRPRRASAAVWHGDRRSHCVVPSWNRSCGSAAATLLAGHLMKV
jgi:hypothetical protein